MENLKTYNPPNMNPLMLKYPKNTKYALIPWKTPKSKIPQMNLFVLK